MKRKIIITLIHLCFWLYYIFLRSQDMMMFEMSKEGGGSGYDYWSWHTFFNQFIPDFISFYFFYFIVFPFYEKTKKKLASFGIGITFLIIAAFLNFLYFKNNMILDELELLDYVRLILGMLVLTIFSFFIYGALGLAFKGFISWFQDQEIKKALNEKNHQMELTLVKAQLDPHFLFNTLNNIDILINKSPEKASTYLNQLSDIMRFMLFETKSELIPLKQEIEYIEKYIALQKIRSINPNFASFQVEGKIDSIKIAPMLFLPFIENAFKHVEDKEIDQAIQIKLSVLSKSIIFECRNRFGQLIEMNAKYNGLGSQLIEKRLNLLYPNSHELSIDKKESSYIVKLTLQKNED